ncbi:hypothetical protein SAMN04489712_13253 [Thermomonospora echinospora]|uniref:Uncharacterized protein n=1 Tax=Thermomonospora echinospora TaxID=1992 RepID=A0A1H6E5M5_9ACTN|nr:hypothetical protein [Thermomonospora echinospora]SEG92195.1 hypothetical protein SAMN04489712_13253 [Thermomonospora echinospora]
MTAPATDRLGRWAVPRSEDLRLAWLLARREFGQEFPGVMVWFGLTSGRWRAMVPAAGGWRLLESAQPDDLRTQIRGALGFWPVSATPHHRRFGGNPDPYRSGR